MIAGLLLDDRGATTVEYALVLALFGLVMLAWLIKISGNANNNYTNSTNALMQLQQNPP